MAIPYNSEANQPLGLESVTINTVAYIVNSVDLASFDNRIISRTDANGDRAGFVSERHFETAEAADWTDYIDAQGHVDIAGLKAAGLSHLIKGTKETKYGVVVEFYDAQAAIDKVNSGSFTVPGIIKDLNGRSIGSGAAG